jgi:hypothetical protein
VGTALLMAGALALLALLPARRLPI